MGLFQCHVPVERVVTRLFVGKKAVSGVLCDQQLRAAPAARLILHDNLDVASEQDQKSYETIQRKARELAAFERGNLGLVDFEDIGGLSLRESLSLDDLRDLVQPDMTAYDAIKLIEDQLPEPGGRHLVAATAPAPTPSECRR